MGFTRMHNHPRLDVDYRILGHTDRRRTVDEKMALDGAEWRVRREDQCDLNRTFLCRHYSLTANVDAWSGSRRCDGDQGLGGCAGCEKGGQHIRTDAYAGLACWTRMLDSLQVRILLLSLS